MNSAIQMGLTGASAFVLRQKRNYRVAITRAAASSFLLNLSQQYSSIYTVALGADTVQLGTVNSVGSAISSLISVPVGWLMDRYGIKRFYLLAIALLAGSALIYGLARDWRAIIVATILTAVAMRLTGTGCSVICADSVHNQDRMTAQNLCVTLASVASVMSPLIAAHLVTVFGGMMIEGLRPLYYLISAGYGLVLVFVAAQLTEPRGGGRHPMSVRRGFVADFRELFEAERSLPRWILLAALTSLPMAMMTPFSQLYAHQSKGADQYILGAMATATVVTRLLFSIPLGRLADTIGRKRVIYLITPLWYVSSLMLVFATGPAMLVAASALQVFYMVSAGATGAMMIELMSLERQGCWSGVLGLFQGLVTIPAPVFGGVLWRQLGPAYVFIIPIAIDLLVRVPLLTTVPETLRQASPRDGADNGLR